MVTLAPALRRRRKSRALRALIYRHLELTESARAKEILGDWARFEPLFWKVVPLPPVDPGTPLAPNNVPVGASTGPLPKP